MEKIRSKILASFLVVITVLMITGGFLVSLNFMIIIKYEQIMANIVSEYELITKTQVLTESFNNLIKYIDDDKKLYLFLDRRDELQDLLITLDTAIETENSFAIYLGIRNILTGLFRDSETGINAMLNRDYKKVNEYQASINAKNNFVRDNTANLLLSEIQSLKETQSEIIRVRILIQLTALSLFIMLILTSIFYAFRFSDKLTKPLEKLSLIAKNIVSGKLDLEVDKKLMLGNNEISSLAVSFDKMLSYLRANISELEKYNRAVEESRNQLRTERNKLRQYLDVAGVFVLIFDLNNKIITVNKKGREIFGINDEDFVGKDWIVTYVDKKDRLKTRSLLNFILSGINGNDTIENIVNSVNYEKKNVVWHFSPLKNDKGVVVSVLGTGIDSTELVRAKAKIDQLREVDELKNEVMNIATHELKTPLISIVGLSEVMKNNPKSLPTEYQEYISIINTEGEKLSHLIKTMLSASRNDLGKVALNLETINLTELQKSLKSSLKMLLKRGDAKLTIDNQFGDLDISSDKDKISQVIYNFVDNAVKYGPQKQTIKIIFKRESQDNLRVEVTGEGKGISKDLQKKLFIKFSQLEPSLSRSQDGMGLGLYICKQNIEALGGTIGVDSELDKGATFYFVVPTKAGLKKNPADAILGTS